MQHKAIFSTNTEISTFLVASRHSRNCSFQKAAANTTVARQKRDSMNYSERKTPRYDSAFAIQIYRENSQQRNRAIPQEND
jgi:hypothetical protein